MQPIFGTFIGNTKCHRMVADPLLRTLKEQRQYLVALMHQVHLVHLLTQYNVLNNDLPSDLIKH